MSDDLLSNPALTGLAGAIGTGALAWLGNRLVGKAAIQTAINASFHEVMDQMRTELKAALRQRDLLEAEITRLEDHIEKEAARGREEREALRAEVQSLRAALQKHTGNAELYQGGPDVSGG